MTDVIISFLVSVAASVAGSYIYHHMNSLFDRNRKTKD